MLQPPTRHLTAPDGTAIAVFGSGSGRPLVLVHGTAADHTTFRVVGPRFADRFEVWAIDRRGRGASGDTLPYAIEREYEDLAVVVDAAADAGGGPVPVVGHSYGGRVGLGAALRTPNIGRLIVYEGAPTPPAASYQPDDLIARLEALAEADRPDRLLETFLREVVGMTDADIAAYRANPVWPDRVAAAPTIVRELRSEASPGGGLETLGKVPVPVLQVLGGASLPVFREATLALDSRLPEGRVEVIDGARHAAHHTHPDAFVAVVTAFLDGTA